MHWNEPTPDLHIGGTWQNIKMKQQIHIDHDPGSSPRIEQKGEQLKLFTSMYAQYTNQDNPVI